MRPSYFATQPSAALARVPYPRLQFREFIRGESAKFAKIIVEAGIKLDK